jgi:poly(A) polymerase
MDDNVSPVIPDLAPVILDRAHHRISRRNIDPDALKVLYRLHGHGFTAYLVGGAVRDLLLGRRPYDFDVGTSAHPNQIKKLFRNAFLIGRRFRLAHIRFHGGKIIEVSTFRRKPDETELEEERREREDAVGPGGEGPGPEPAPAAEGPEAHETQGMADEAASSPDSPDQAEVQPPDSPACRPPLRPIAFGTPQEDAFRRDLTINALFYDIATFSVIDYVGGLDDLEHGLIRTIADPDESFAEDPVRIWRVIRHAARLDFTIEAGTAQAICPNRERLAVCSSSRLFEEFNKDLKSGSSRPFFELARRHGILPAILGDIGQLYQESEEAFGRLAGFLEAVDEAVRRNAALHQEIAYALFLWPWAESRLAAAQGDKARVLFEAFRQVRTAVQFPKGLILDVVQTMVIVEHMLAALATGRMRWALKKRRHYALAAPISAFLTQGVLTDDGQAFDRIFDARFGNAFPPGKRRRRRRPRKKRPGPPPAP